MVKVIASVVCSAILVVLPLSSVEAGDFKNHGQCVKACVQDLGVEQNRACSELCKGGTYGQPAGGGLPAGASCDPIADECAAPYACTAFYPPMYFPGMPLEHFCW